MDAGFEGPRAVAVDVEEFADGDGQVLVPGDFPVGVFVFVEVDAADDACVFTENGRDK